MRLGSVLVVAVALSGCGTSLPPVTPDLVAQAQARGIAADAARLERGRTVVATRCTTCHPAHHPQEKTVAEWPAVLEVMGPRAYLPAAERAEVLAYLQAAAR